jgi:hypothetical protein
MKRDSIFTSSALSILAAAAACGSGAPSAEVRAGHASAERAWAYVLGNDAVAPADAALRARLDDLRDALASGGARIYSVGETTIEGHDVGLYKIYGTCASGDDVAEVVDAVGAALSTATPLAGRFFAATHERVTIDGVQWNLAGIDPSTATLNAGTSLDGTAGAAAVASFTDSGAPTQIFLWPSSWARCSPSLIAAFTPSSASTPTGNGPVVPCSPYPLSAGASTPFEIHKNQAYCRCALP